MKAALAAITIVSMIFFTASCSSTPKDEGNYIKAYLADSPEEYELLGIRQDGTEIWEDGMRTDGKEGVYEWWYIDAEFADGTTIVATFYTKDGFDVPGPAHPKVTIDITYADGTKVIREVFEPDGTLINSSKERADVNVGDCYLRYTDGDYELYFNDGIVEYSAYMESTLPMWRPDTAHWYFGEEKDFFAWFVAQPSSIIQATLRINGQITELVGTGYHDHNWGNIAMNEVINHWYWGRAQVGDYSIIACDIISEENTGYTRLPVFMIARNGVILDDDQNLTSVIREETIEHPETGKFYNNNIKYIQESADGTVYTVEMKREEDIVYHSFLDSLSAGKKTLAKMVGANPTYLRILGEVILTIEKDGEVEVIEQEGLWEQMFFGNNKEAYIWN
jgi:hypothetical protein